MPQVFVSYARSDKRRVTRLIRALRSAGFEPWWDDDIPAGAGWEQTIEKALAEAQAVIVCWSPVSVASENVRSEARVARTQNRLVQTFLEPCEPPLFFGERQGVDLTGWNGSVKDPRFDRVREALGNVVGAPRAENRLPGPTRSGFLHWRALATLLLALLAFGGLWWWSNAARTDAASRIAVQPVEALGDSTAVTSAARGLTDQVRTSLNEGHIPSISPADSEGLTGSGGERRLRSLGVGYTLEGTIEASGSTLHARLHLDDRIRHASLWSYEATGATGDPSALNATVARSVAGVISCAYRALGPGGLTNTELLSRYLRVCDLFVNHNDASDTRSTFELFDDLRLIMAKAPNFAPAQSDFAKFGAYLAPLLPADQAATVRSEAARAATRALELDPHAADAYIAREMLLAPTDWSQRETLLRKAVSVDPKWPHSNGFLAMFLQETGRLREAAIYGQRAAAADLQIDWRPYGAVMACEAGREDTVIADLRDRLQIVPSDDVTRWSLRRCLLIARQFRDAQKLLDPSPAGATDANAFINASIQALASGSPQDRQKASAIAAKLPLSNDLLPGIIEYSAALGDLDTAFRLAARFAPGYPMTGTTSFLFSPLAEPMRRDSRFAALTKSYGLAQFWRSTGRWPDFCSGIRLTGCQAGQAPEVRRPKSPQQPARSQPPAGEPTSPPPFPAPPPPPPNG